MPSVRLLFVDDEPSILLTLSAILANKGFDVTTAPSVPAALKLINSDKFDVLISDLNIGEPGDGFTVVSAMRRVQPEAATFILTGYPDFESALLAIRNQVDDYFIKPADVGSLVETITKRISTPKLALRDRPYKRLHNVLQDNAQDICDQWLSVVAHNPELAAIPLSDEERIDHLPSMLQELVERLKRGADETSDNATTAAQPHGEVRYQQRYSIAQLVSETRILQRTIAATVQANLLGVDVSSLVPDLVEVGESLTHLLEVSIRAYQAKSAGASNVQARVAY
jgi:ActR/RegA family two-component response regulator